MRRTTICLSVLLTACGGGDHTDALDAATYDALADAGMALPDMPRRMDAAGDGVDSLGDAALADDAPGDAGPVCAAGESVCGGGTARGCADLSTDPVHCGGCETVCVAPNATAACRGGVCAVGACDPGFGDADGNAANGCECHVSAEICDGLDNDCDGVVDNADPGGGASCATGRLGTCAAGTEACLGGAIACVPNALPAASDPPDLAFLDSDCDGIDGTPALAVFVSPRGDDAYAGTMDAPKRTLAAAIHAAAIATPPLAVYAALGTYSGTVALVAGVSLYGGYDDADHWSRSDAVPNITTIQGDTSTGVLGVGIDAPTELQLVTIRAENGSAPGGSSYGVRIAGATAEVTLRGCSVFAGDGAPGASGSSGVPGAYGGSGGIGPDDLTSGAAGSSACGAAGGIGGAAVSGEVVGNPGGDGVTNVALLGGAGGHGGTAPSGVGTCCLPSPSAPDDATPGSPGADGANAPALTTDIGDLATDGTYSPPTAADGSPGRPGGGGGGGASGSGGLRSGAFPCEFGAGCIAVASADGGGGGGGGCGGGAGQGGGGGGGSVAVVSYGSSVTLDRCTLTTGRGGDGGAGGAGASPGGGGFGGNADFTTGSSGFSAGGREGGRGGSGGSGAGAPGGPAICVFDRGTPPTTPSTSPCTRGAGGNGGLGGSLFSGLPRAPDGLPGVSVDTLAGS